MSSAARSTLVLILRDDSGGSRWIARSIDRVEAHEKFTLELGSCIVLLVLGLGLQLGHLSSWSALVAVAAYLAWVAAYSEVTVHVARRRAAIAARPRTATRLSA